MPDFTIILTLVNTLAVLGGFVYFSLKGGNKASDDVIQIFKLRDIEQKAQIKEYQEKFEGIKLEIGKLQGALQERDKKLEEYVAIFQGRNPQMEKFIKMMEEAVQQSQSTLQKSDDYMQRTEVILKEIRDFMDKMNKRQEATEKFNKQIADATEHETGKPLRK